ncbi:MAG TPA: hypothetical protein PK006_10970 [Saprospiraceae bacterium]|nr:hypothetical protein [Saprospiraceae bacterium]
MRLLSIGLAVLILLSGTGLSLFKHVCSSKGTSYGIYTSAEHCCSKQKKCSSSDLNHQHQGPSISKTPCCSDESYFAKSNLFFQSLILHFKVQATDWNEIKFTLFEFQDQYQSSSHILPSLLIHAPPNKQDLLSWMQQFRC